MHLFVLARFVKFVNKVPTKVFSETESRARAYTYTPCMLRGRGRAREREREMERERLNTDGDWGIEEEVEGTKVRGRG